MARVKAKADKEYSYISKKRCEVVQYLEYYDDYAKLQERIQSLDGTNKWAYILHDQDVNPDGSRKDPHFHLVMTFHNNKTFDSIGKAIGVETQYVNTIKRSTASAFLYLIHFNDPEKHQYDPEEVVANFDYPAFVEKYRSGKAPAEMLDDIFSKIATGEIKEYNIDKEIPCALYAKNKSKIDNAFKWRHMRTNGVDRNMKTLFITGEPGSGKTTLAKYYADQNGLKAYVSSGGKNPLDDYKGEECIILDDCRDTTYPMIDLLKLTDNNTNSLVGCRFYNKSIGECQMLIITSCVDIDQWYGDSERDESKHQLYRRFPEKIYCTHEQIILSQYNRLSQYEPDQPLYKKVMNAPNPCYKMYDREAYEKDLKARSVALLKGLGVDEEYIKQALDDSDLPF